MTSRMRWDIFCTVIDNYGDIGITWRLARQLAREHCVQVRLWVDDLASFRQIQPDIRLDLESQMSAGVEIRHWPAEFPSATPADVVIEAMACHLPEAYEHAMAQKPIKPVWINLEYLSAEDWVSGCHGLPSPHPHLPLTKYFFMPGYTRNTGGVLKENWLNRERDSFQMDRRSRDAFWHALDLPPDTEGELRISLFSYESRAIASLFNNWTTSDKPVRCLVPRGKALADVTRYFGLDHLEDGASMRRGALTVHVLPMIDMDDYDRLLWACDCNFVRGEDSFVRAQWAGKPLVWQAYRQEESAHWPKIEAFLALYCRDLSSDAESALRGLWLRWNEDGDAGAAWPEFHAHWPEFMSHGHGWRKTLDANGDLTTNLVNFCNEKS